jgi:type IV secretory pathway VirB4 component
LRRVIARATPKRDYYYHSRLGSRLFDLALGPVAMAFAGASKPHDQCAMDEWLAKKADESFAAAWPRHKGLPSAAA